VNSTVALLTRSLRLQARSSGPHVARVGLIVLLALLLLVSSDMWRIGGAAGRYVLMQISWCLLLVGTAVGITQFSGAVAEEKEEGNLGLLRMAGLGPAGLLVGVGLARLWDMLLLSACALPVAVLAVTLGGVALGQVAALYAAILAWFVALAGLGLLASTVAPTAAKAGSLLVAILVALYGMPALLSSLAHSGGATGLGEAMDAWQQLSVWSRLGAIPMGSPDTWWGWQPVIDVALGAAGATGALLLYPRLARDSHDTGGERSGAVRRWLPIGRPRSGLLAIAWKDFHVELGGWRMLIFKGMAAIAGAVLDAGWVGGSDRSLEQIGESWMWPALFWVIIETGVHLSRQWSGELRNHTAELLFMLPVERPTLAYAKLFALPLALAPPLLWFAAGVVLAPESFFKALGNILSEVGGWYGIVMVVFWWHSAAWLSLRWPRFAIAGSIILLVLVQIVLGIFAMLVRGSDGVLVLVIIGLAIPIILMHASFAGRWFRRL
jgi:hypothetical protein